MPGARCTRSLACEIKKAHKRIHHRSPNSRRFLRNGFNGFLRALPGDRACLHRPRPRCAHRSDLISASGFRTTRLRRPLLRFVFAHNSVHRIPLPTFVTIAKRPSWMARDGREDGGDLGARSMRVACDQLARRANHAARRGSQRQVRSNSLQPRHRDDATPMRREEPGRRSGARNSGPADQRAASLRCCAAIRRNVCLTTDTGPRPCRRSLRVTFENSPSKVAAADPPVGSS